MADGYWKSLFTAASESWTKSNAARAANWAKSGAGWGKWLGNIGGNPGGFVRGTALKGGLLVAGAAGLVALASNMRKSRTGPAVVEQDLAMQEQQAQMAEMQRQQMEMMQQQMAAQAQAPGQEKPAGYWQGVVRPGSVPQQEAFVQPASNHADAAMASKTSAQPGVTPA